MTVRSVDCVSWIYSMDPAIGRSCAQSSGVTTSWNDGHSTASFSSSAVARGQARDGPPQRRRKNQVKVDYAMRLLAGSHCDWLLGTFSVLPGLAGRAAVFPRSRSARRFDNGNTVCTVAIKHLTCRWLARHCSGTPRFGTGIELGPGNG